MVEDLAHHILNIIPLLLSADILGAVVGIPLGETVGNVLIQAYCLEHKSRKLYALLELVLELLGCAHEVSL